MSVAGCLPLGIGMGHDQISTSLLNYGIAKDLMQSTLGKDEAISPK